MLDRARYQDAVVIASALEAHPRYHDWVCSRSVVEDVMENGWIRYNANESFNAYIRFVVNPRVDPRSWLSQANNIFSSLHIESDLDNYAFVDNVCFTIIVSEPMVDCPPGYLFVCPQQHFHVGASAFRWPDSPAYWSLDPSGVERLSMGEAIRLGFPDFRPLTEVHCYSWETSVYDELWQFYWGKGFDPESQDVAQYLGDRLFHVSSAINPLLAHVDHEEYGEEDENWAERSDNEEQSDHSFPVPDEHAPDNVDTEPRSTSPVAGTTMYQGQSPKNTSSESTIHLTDEDVPISVTHKILMTIQLAFMLFIATCWVYDNLQ
ncbi:hypothetical protein C8R46DRAFT_242061 [Mycena filopes]|nr:hypothetical protein C8R46DRAFT_242061 [Mycena filopes]